MKYCRLHQDRIHGHDGAHQHTYSISTTRSAGYTAPICAKRIDAPVDATLGVMTGALLAVTTISQALALARGMTIRHVIKQVDHLMINAGIDVWFSFGHWVRRPVGFAQDVQVAMD